MSNERPTDVDIKRQIFRECAGAAEALARAFRGADAAFPELSRDASVLVERQISELARRTMRLVEAVGIVGVSEEDRTPVIVSRLRPSKYFHPDELRCRDGTPYPEAFEIRWTILSTELDTIREAEGIPLVVVSGYRSIEHNAKLGAVEKSQHPEGRAVDLRPRPPRLLTVADIHHLHATINRLLDEGKLPAVRGVGVYPLVRDRKTNLLFPGWVHVDTRPSPSDGHIARWEGEYFGSEKP